MNQLPLTWTDHLLCWVRLYRRRRGGVWELWTTPTFGFRWFHLMRPSSELGTRPDEFCMGTPQVEDYR